MSAPLVHHCQWESHPCPRPPLPGKRYCSPHYVYFLRILRRWLVRECPIPYVDHTHGWRNYPGPMNARLRAGFNILHADGND